MHTTSTTLTTLLCLKKSLPKIYEQFTILGWKLLYKHLYPKDKLEIIYTSKYQKILINDRYIEFDSQNKKKNFEKALSGKKIKPEKFAKLCFARCKSCLRRTNYAELYCLEYDATFSHCYLFICWECYNIYFVCGNCFDDTANSLITDFKKSITFQVDLLELTTYHNYEFDFLNFILSKSIKEKELTILHENDDLKLFIENGKLGYFENGEKKELTRGGLYKFIHPSKDRLEFLDGRIVHHSDRENNEEDYHNTTDLNLGIFYFKGKYGDMTGPDGGFPSKWKCGLHGTIEFNDK